MPNHVKNTLEFQGDQPIINFVMKLIKGGDEFSSIHIDFNTIVPCPAFTYNHSISSKEEDMCTILGIDNWVDWNRKNWGTKWNAYGQKKEGNCIEFNTAWTTCMPIMEALVKRFPMLSFKLIYADEDIGSNCGIIEGSGGEITKAFVPDELSEDAYHISFHLHPEQEKYYSIVDGNYEYI